jgi:hypothetical protein
MKLRTRKETPADQLRNAAVEAALGALDDLQGRSKRKPALSGLRAVGTGVVLFTAGRLALKGRRSVRQDADEETSSAPAKPRPVRRAARTERPRPSLDLPQQRWPRMAASRR